MLIFHKGHTDTIQVYSVTVMTHVKALQAGHSSQGTSEPITPGCGLDDRMVAAVTIPSTVPDQLDTLLRWLLPTPVVPASPLKPVPTALEILLKCLLVGVLA